MWIFISYLIAGVITARFLDKKKYSVAMIAYIVMFSVLLCFVIIIQDKGPVADAVRNVVGENGFHILNVVLRMEAYSGLLVSYPLLIIEAIAGILVFAAVLILAGEVFAAVAVQIKKTRRIHGRQESINCFRTQKPIFDNINPKFIIFCRLTT